MFSQGSQSQLYLDLTRSTHTHCMPPNHNITIFTKGITTLLLCHGLGAQGYLSDSTGSYSWFTTSWRILTSVPDPCSLSTSWFPVFGTVSFPQCQHPYLPWGHSVTVPWQQKHLCWPRCKSTLQLPKVTQSHSLHIFNQTVWHYWQLQHGSYLFVRCLSFTKSNSLRVITNSTWHHSCHSCQATRNGFTTAFDACKVWYSPCSY